MGRRGVGEVEDRLSIDVTEEQATWEVKVDEEDEGSAVEINKEELRAAAAAAAAEVDKEGI